MQNELRDAFDLIDYMKRGRLTAVEIQRYLDLHPSPS